MSAQQRLPYSVVRFYYDRVRDEAINVGVVVQTPAGLRVKTGPIDAIRRAYPFIDPDLVTRQLKVLTTTIGHDHIEVFDYKSGAPVDLKSSDLEVLTVLNNELPESLALTPPRFAELATETPPGVQAASEALLDHLFTIFVEPPKPSRDLAVEMPGVRRAHTVLRRRAVREIVRSARRAGFKREDLEMEPRVRGRTREWTLDVRIPRPGRSRPGHFLQHILVLPEIEETYHEAAALARIWQDIRQRRPTAGLTAVFYSTNGIPYSKLKEGVRLLAADKIETVYVKDLPRHYNELVGQRRLDSKN